jgi:hypothetical protein
MYTVQKYKLLPFWEYYNKKNINKLASIMYNTGKWIRFH